MASIHSLSGRTSSSLLPCCCTNTYTCTHNWSYSSSVLTFHGFASMNSCGSESWRGLDWTIIVRLHTPPTPQGGGLSDRPPQLSVGKCGHGGRWRGSNGLLLYLQPFGPDILTEFWINLGVFSFCSSLVLRWHGWSLLLHPHPAGSAHWLCTFLEWILGGEDGRRQFPLLVCRYGLQVYR